MTTKENRASIAVAVSVWLVASGSAAVVMYDVSRSLPWVTRASQLETPSTTARAAEGEAISEAQSVLYIPTITIVGQTPPPPAVAVGPRAP